MNSNDEYRKLFDDELPRPINRRRKPDKVIRNMKIFSLLSWVLIFTALLMTYYAAPQSDLGKILNDKYGKEVRGTWQPEYLNYAIFLMIPAFLLGLAALFLNSKRMKRKYDKYYIAVILSLVIPIVSIIVIMLVIISFSI